MKIYKYNIITIGCQMNFSDSERVAGFLESIGFKPTENKNNADIVVLVTCGVRQSAEDRIYGLIPLIKKENPQSLIILTGCLSQRKDVRKRIDKYVDIWLPISEIIKLQILLSEKKINSKIFKEIDGKNKLNLKNINYNYCDYLSIKPQYDSKISAFIPIGNGCNNFCTYCVVPYARGREIYRSAEEIFREARYLIKNRYKEIFLIAQNVNSYKSKNQNIDFADLLKKINNIPGDFWIRFATSHPKDMSDKLIKTINGCNKVCKHIHLPVQAGDDRILKKMNRNYNIAHYKKLIGRIRRLLPGVSISTDVIVGFPSENKTQFNNTKKLFKEVEFDMAYLAQYSPRPGTVAEKFKDNVSSSEKKKREVELNNILKQTALKFNRRYINKIVKVLIDSKNKDREFFGRTETNKNLKIVNNTKKINLVGKFIFTKVIKANNFSLLGEIVKYEK